VAPVTVTQCALGLCGSYGGLNVGDEAILTAAVEQLRAELPGVSLTVFTRDVRHTRANHDVERVIDTRQTLRNELVREIKQLDLLLLGGGGILYDREAESYLHIPRIAQSLGIRTATYAIGAGPLRREEDRRAVALVLNQMAHVTVRDASARRLLEEIGVDREITVTADPAVLLRPASLPPGARSSEGIGSSGRLVGISVREPGDATDGPAHGVYHRLLAHAADFAAARFDADAVFVPMERQDLSHAHRVIAQMGFPDRATVLRGVYSPAQLLQFVSTFDLAIGMRLHFAIFAALGGVPVLALPYAVKVKAFIDRLGLPTLPLVQQEHAGALLASIDRLWDGRGRTRELLAARVGEIKQDAGRTARIVAELVRPSLQDAAA
jgi:polysaccharide pyruvyl transferase CsaB